MRIANFDKKSPKNEVRERGAKQSLASERKGNKIILSFAVETNGFALPCEAVASTNTMIFEEQIITK